MNIKQKFNRMRIGRLLNSRMKMREVLRKAHWLEFENENILNFLAKYSILTKGRKKPIVTTKNTRTIEDTNITPRPNFDLSVIEL
jgi:hypothetical protein